MEDARRKAKVYQGQIRRSTQLRIFQVNELICLSGSLGMEEHQLRSTSHFQLVKQHEDQLQASHLLSLCSIRNYSFLQVSLHQSFFFVNKPTFYQLLQSFQISDQANLLVFPRELRCQPLSCDTSQEVQSDYAIDPFSLLDFTNKDQKILQSYVQARPAVNYECQSIYQSLST